MFNNQTTVDVHGHMTTPAVFRQFPIDCGDRVGTFQKIAIIRV